MTNPSTADVQIFDTRKNSGAKKRARSPGELLPYESKIVFGIDEATWGEWVGR